MIIKTDKGFEYNFLGSFKELPDAKLYDTIVYKGELLTYVGNGVWEQTPELDKCFLEPNIIINNPQYYSLILWNTDFSNIPTEYEYLVVFKDNTGDYPYTYTTTATRLFDHWIAKDDIICDEPIMWAKIPNADKDIREM